MNTRQPNSILLFLLMLVLGSYSVAHAVNITGAWTKKEQAIAGSWSIEVRNEGHYLVLSEDFKTRKAPDLKLVLSKQSVDQVTSKTAMQNAQIVSPLQSNTGAQSYRLPDNYADYASLLLHCEEYTKLWGAAALY